VILGGPNASNLGERILRRHPEVDYVAYGDGERTLVGLVRGERFRQVPNLWLRDTNGKPVFSAHTCTDLNSLPAFDFRHLVKSDLAKYRRTDAADFDLALTPVPVSSIRGCPKAERQGPCAYCSMPKRTFRMMEPALAWEQIRHLNAVHGITYFFETGDSFAVGDYPERFLRAKPPGLNVRFRNYADPSSLNAENIRIFKKLGVSEVFIGVESIDDDVLRQANKPYDTGKTEQAIALLEQSGIRVFIPFLFGLPGETSASVDKSSRFARYLVKKYRNIQRVLFSLALPLVGTTWFNNLLADCDLVREYNGRGSRSLLSDDDIEYERLFLLSLKRCCRIKFSEIYNTLARQIAEIAQERLASFGCLEGSVLRLAGELSA
jgi:radical SAM superfamily enzyme YgiQ (UPF0313 family)